MVMVVIVPCITCIIWCLLDAELFSFDPLCCLVFRVCKVNKRTRELILSDPHQATNTKHKDGQIQ